jgi:hypothetical protein
MDIRTENGSDRVRYARWWECGRWSLLRLVLCVDRESTSDPTRLPNVNTPDTPSPTFPPPSYDQLIH